MYSNRTVLIECVYPYDYNSLVVKSLGSNHFHAGQVCGLSSNIYNHRLRYAIGKLLDIPSKNITGFTLKNLHESIEPYWPSITIKGQCIKLTNGESSKIQENFSEPSMSNNALQEKFQTTSSSSIKRDEKIKKHKHLVNTSSHLNMKKFRKKTPNHEKKIAPDDSKQHQSISHFNRDISNRILQWHYSNTFLQSIKTNRKISKTREKHHQTLESSVSNNATNTIESQRKFSQLIQDEVIKHLNGWHCLQILYHRPYEYTLGMNLCEITRSIMSNSQEMLILSAYIQPFFQQQFTKQVTNKE
ncbi:unnamed protein product [Rotaria magnacalcarata]|uniref:Uncharacterized protein n=1 Tax=Rotaria magnacalcarata TaxID=392030 RepID=A0A8S2IKG8_9BILA|nr:unnamed protein product [Rotaria magnacalcarata]CAF4004225.1 unnamed protein product [Rotaria magnacalcarata]